MPPIVARFDVEVSGPKPSLKRRAARLRSSCTTPGTDPHAARVGVDLVDHVHMPRRVDHEPAAAGGLAGQARPAAARHHGHAEAAGDRHRRGDVVGVARERDRQRLDRVQARVSREQVAGIRVVSDLARELSPQRRPPVPP